MTIQEYSRKLNRDIHYRIFQSNHFESTFGDYEKCFTSLDLIEDCEDAIDEFLGLPESNLPKRSVLYIYGVLQAIYCQQDGLFGLHKNISKSKFKKLNEFFSHFEFDTEIREIRNDIAGHPTSRKRDSEFYFIDKGPNSKFRFSYAGYKPEFRIVEVDLKYLIEEQEKFAKRVLQEVDTIIKCTVKEHKNDNKDISLYSIISNLNYSIQLINRGIHDSQRSFQAEGSINIVSDKIDEFRNELNSRYCNSIPEGLEYTCNNIDYILKRVGKWYDEGKLLENEDAKIFMNAFDKEFDDLKQMAEEIDLEY